MADRPPAPAAAALDLRDHVAFDTAGARVHVVTATRHLGISVACLEPRQTLPAQTLPGDRLYTVIGGRAYAVVEDAEITLDPLQGVLVPAGAAHGIRNDSADPLILQVVTSPPAAGDPGEASTRAGAAGAGASRNDTSSGERIPEDRFSRIRRLLGSR